MPRPSSAAPRATLQTSTSASRAGPKQTARLSSSARSATFTDSPKAVDQPAAAAAAAAAASASNPLDAVPDSPHSASQSVYFAYKNIKEKQH